MSCNVCVSVKEGGDGVWCEVIGGSEQVHLGCGLMGLGGVGLKGNMSEQSLIQTEKLRR